MVYLKYNSVKLPVLDNYNIAKSSQEITFSDLKCDFTGHQKADLPEKYQEVRVVEESKVNREIEKIEYEEKKDVKELSFESKVKEKISICKVHGYSSQETTEGYQLLNLQSGMQNGITYYVDDEGYFYISGTCTSDRITLNLNEMVLNGTYTFTSKSISGGGINCVLKDNTSEYKNIFWANNNNNTKEVNAISKDLVCYLTNGATYNSKIKLMLVSGSQEKDVEPYTGGIPSPNPDYSSEIETVGSNVNLCNGINQGYYLNFATDLCGLLSENNGLIIPITGGKYTISTQINQTRYRVACINEKPIEDKTVTAYKGVNKDGTSNNITIDTSGYAYLVINATDLTKVKIEKGSIATPYSPYGMGSVEIDVVNKNLFNDTKTFAMASLSYSNGIYSASDNDTATRLIYKIQQYDSNRKFILSAGEVKQNIDKSGIYYFTAQKYTTAKYLRIANSGKTKEFSLFYPLDDINVGDYYTVVINIIDTTIGASKFKNVMLLKGKITSASYIEHKSQSIIMPIQQEMLTGDYISDKEYHNWNKYVFTGEENISKSGVEVNNSYWINQNSIPDLLNAELLNDNTRGTIVPNFLSTHFKTLAPTYVVYHNNVGITLCANNLNLKDVTIRFGFGLDSDINTADKCKTWLKSQYDAGTPVIVYYKLAEEVVEPYTVEQQKAWNNMRNLVSYVGINNINSSTNTDVKYPVRIKKEIVPETYDKLLYTGYIDDYVFDEMRELDEDINVNFTLLSPQKIATLRTCIAVGTYEIKDLIENIILAPLIDDGFTLKEINIVNKSLTVNFLVETVEYCMNNLSNKYNFWWYIDENKNIYVKDIETMFKEEPMYIYDDKHTIDGLEYVKPITNSYDYANVINFKNVRIYEYSRLRMNKKEVAEAHNPLIDGQVTNIKQNDQITFNFPIDIKKENIIKSANSNGITNTNIIYGIYVEGTYEDNTDFSFFVSFDTLNNLYKISDNLGFDGESTDSEKEFLLMRDSFFSNLITGIKYNNGNKKINSIKAINSDSTLIYNVNKFLNDKGILEKKNIISKTGIVERTIDMKESWKTVQELTEIGASYLNKNSLNYADELEIKLDKDKFQVGKILYINKFMIDGRYVVTEIQRTDQNNDDEFLVKCKNANILDNFIDIFRQENEQTSSDKVYQLYVTHYEEEGISERFEVVQ